LVFARRNRPNVNEPVPIEPALVRLWRPVFPPGTLRSIILHWTAGDYATTFPAYHFCLTGSSEVQVHATADLQANMRDVTKAPEPPYVAHTAGRNSFAAGIAVCGMRGATPENFGDAPLTAEQIEALCVVAAAVARHYDIGIGRIRTHAEAAMADNYFGAGSADLRWDLARLEPASGALAPEEATAAGDVLRARIAELG